MKHKKTLYNVQTTKVTIMTAIKTNPRAPMSRMDVARFCVIMRRYLTNSHTKRQRQRLEEMQAEMDYIFETISKNNNENK